MNALCFTDPTATHRTDWQVSEVKRWNEQNKYTNTLIWWPYTQWKYMVSLSVWAWPSAHSPHSHSNTVKKKKEAVHALNRLYSLPHTQTHLVWHASLMRHTWTLRKPLAQTEMTGDTVLGLVFFLLMTRVGYWHKSRQWSRSSALIN